MTKFQRQGLMLFFTGWGALFASHGEWWTLLPISIGWFMCAMDDAAAILANVMYWVWRKFRPLEVHQNAVRVARQATEPHE